MASREYFKGKRVAVIGLGMHGEMVEDVKYLIKAGAWVSIYDLKSEARLKNHLVFLRSIGLANYVCGSIPSEDLLDMDLIILSHEYPRDSSFLKHVHAHNEASKAQNNSDASLREQTIAEAETHVGTAIPIEYQETLFFRLAPPITLVGVIGTCGKSTVISIIKPMLERVCESYDTQGLYVADPESAGGIVSLLKRIKNGDIVIMRIIPDMISELHDMRISPHVAIFTDTPSSRLHGSPFGIISYQTYNNFIVASDEVIDTMRSGGIQPRAKMLRTKATLIPDEWCFFGCGPHDRMNAALALQAAKLFKVDEEIAHHVCGNWKPLKGRLELVKKVRGVEFYNDTMSVTPQATLTGIAALSQEKNLVLIFGGTDGGHEYRSLYNELARYVHTIINIPGSGTLRERHALLQLDGVDVRSAPSIEEAVRSAFECAHKGDRILFSPGFDAGGVEGSRIERGEKFVKAVRGL